MNSSIIAFSKYLAHPIGGAEISMYSILKKEILQGKTVKLIAFRGVKNFGAETIVFDSSFKWDFEYIDPLVQFTKFMHYEYLLNRHRVMEFFKNLESSKSNLYTYSIYAPAAILAYKGESTYFIRSANDLLVRENYFQGLKRNLKDIYSLFEKPSIEQYKKDLIVALNKSKVITNSHFMSDLLQKRFNISSIVKYPNVDVKGIKKDILTSKNVETKGIVFVGDLPIKGTELAYQIAQLMPDQIFYFFSRYQKKREKIGNIYKMPWQKSKAEIYNKALVVIVPSICQEAFGRVSREAFLLGIPVLVSNVGGLPESVNYKSESIINKYTQVHEWVKRIKEFLG